MSRVIAALKQKMQKEEAMKIAEKKGDWLWNIVFCKSPLSEVRLIYIEYVLLDIETVSSPTLMSKIRKKASQPVRKKLKVLVNGSTGGVSLVTDQNLQIEEIELNDEAEMQNKAFDDAEADKRAKVLAHKITHRAMGGMHEAEIVGRLSIYRPFWVAFYGDMKQGNRVRYITIAADGGQHRRAR